MRRILFFFLIISVYDWTFAQNPVPLKPWVEVIGETSGMQLGLQVTGFIPHPNFPYRAGISQLGKTGLYKLQNQSDKNPYGFVPGDNLNLADLNGDGNGDLIFHKSGNFIAPDTVIIYWGTINGLDTINTTKLIGEAKGEGFGVNICIGNIIGDSLNDLFITATGYPQGYALGRIYIYQGSQQFSTIPNYTLTGDSIRYTYGWNCAIADLNNDGKNDLIIRGYNQNTQPVRYGYLDIYWGSASFDTIRDIRINGKNNSQKGLACFDVNGDGISDLLWTIRDSLDWIYVHYGGNNFSPTPSNRLKDPGIAAFGKVVVNAGDMNGDGFNDVAVGSVTGAVTSYVLVFGGGPKMNGEYDAFYELSLSEFGSTVSTVGDVNGDGLSDIIVGAPDYFAGQAKGYWGIFLGSTNIKVTSVETEQPLKPQFFELYQNYPNPFNGQTTFSYSLEQDSAVRIVITNSLGQEVSVLPQGVQNEGFHTVRYNAKDLSSGWYVITLRLMLENGQSFSQSRAMIVEK